MKKKGLSAIITTLMFILLAFVAVGIVWGVVSNIVDKGVDQIDLSSKCLEIGFDVIKTDCVEEICNITIERKAGGDEISGIKLLVVNETDSVSILKEGNIGQHLKKTYTNEDTNITNLIEVKIIPYLEDEFGNAKDCTV